MAHAVRMPKPGQMTEECTLVALAQAGGRPGPTGATSCSRSRPTSPSMDVEAFDDGVLLQDPRPGGRVRPGQHRLRLDRRGRARRSRSAAPRAAGAGAAPARVRPAPPPAPAAGRPPRPLGPAPPARRAAAAPARGWPISPARAGWRPRRGVDPGPSRAPAPTAGSSSATSRPRSRPGPRRRRRPGRAARRPARARSPARRRPARCRRMRRVIAERLTAELDHDPALHGHGRRRRDEAARAPGRAQGCGRRPHGDGLRAGRHRRDARRVPRCELEDRRRVGLAAPAGPPRHGRLRARRPRRAGHPGRRPADRHRDPRPGCRSGRRRPRRDGVGRRPDRQHVHGRPTWACSGSRSSARSSTPARPRSSPSRRRVPTPVAVGGADRDPSDHEADAVRRSSPGRWRDSGRASSTRFRRRLEDTQALRQGSANSRD